MRTKLWWLLCLLATPVFAAPQLDKLTLPPGFHIAVYSDQVPNAREITLGAKRTVFVGSGDAGKVYVLTDSRGRQRTRCGHDQGRFTDATPEQTSPARAD